MLKQVGKYYNSVIKPGKKIKKESNYNKKYIKKRYNELLKKGYSTKQIEQMIYFELGTGAVLRESISFATTEECISIGMLVGTEIGATVGAALGNINSVGTGATLGGGIGTYFGNKACGRIIEFASEKAVQSVSEKLWANNKAPSQEQIDTYYLKAYTADKNKKLSNFSPEKAIKTAGEAGNNILKTGISNNVYLNDNFDTKADYGNYINAVTKSNKIYTKESINNMSQDEIHANKKAIEYQSKTIGIPTNEQAAESGMVFVNTYSRSDGTKV